ncbi:MAG: hypothetical protein JWQ85_587, partial [Mucilaginibacter sp.]|nr:hypothetical protein [Mucilaginibacter sp.]
MYNFYKAIVFKCCKDLKVYKLQTVII